jgi:NADH-quinone oxidoreductase subunit L
VLLSFGWAVRCITGLMPLEQPYSERYFDWIVSGTFRIGAEFALDRLTAVMLMVVTGIGSLIHIYSIGYMAHEGGYYRFFSYMNLFMFFMLVLVLGANFPILFVGWEGVGLCSYLLIGFYFREKFASDAANKAFIVNRIGDFGFLLAMFLIFITFGSLDFAKVFPAAKEMPVEQGFGTLTAICLLLLLGATGKSAQIPLYVWLPDAMAGPTPVSALIHAATMVTAGVYMSARASALFTHAPIALETVAIIGLATAFIAATIGLAQTDIKKVFAYSTVSQLGYMFVGVGVGAFSAGIFHLMTHAFFKALLFLGAGSVIHALGGEQDLRKMGGLRTKIPITFWTLMAAGVAIAGIPPFSGFKSKDEILLAAHHHAPWMYWVGVVTAAMTAFYVFRALFLTFFGEPRWAAAGTAALGGHTHDSQGHAAHGHSGDDHGHSGGHGHGEPHESPAVMWIPLAILAVLSLAGGYISVPHWLEPLFGHGEAPHESLLVYISVAAGAIGIALAYMFYVASPGLADSVANTFKGLYNLIYNKYFVDEFYDATVVQPVVQGSRTVLWRGFDAGFIDGLVNGIGKAARSLGGFFSLAQSGNIRSYAAWVLLGSLAVIAYIGIWGGAR